MTSRSVCEPRHRETRPLHRCRARGSADAGSIGGSDLVRAAVDPRPHAVRAPTSAAAAAQGLGLPDAAADAGARGARRELISRPDTVPELLGDLVRALRGRAA